MTVGQLREHLAALPGELEVQVELDGRMVAAEGFHRYPRAVVLFESDPDEPHGGRPAGYIDPDESPQEGRYCEECGLRPLHDGHLLDCSQLV